MSEQGAQADPDSTTDEPLREEDVRRSDVLDDRVQEGDGLEDDEE